MKRRARSGYVRAFDYDGSSPINRRKVQQFLEAIWAEYELRLSAKVSFENGSDTRNESAKNFLRREVYALGSRLERSAPQSWRFDDLVNEIRQTNTTRPAALSNIFHALLMCIYETDSRISRQERSLMAMELEYAHRHVIPPSLLCGFLYQSTDRKRIGKRLQDGFIEPAFRE